MSWPLYKKIIDEVSQERPLQVLWLMKDGEPLMHPKIDTLIAYAKKKKAAKRIEIYSNGFFLDNTMVEKLILAGLNVLTISLDAVDRHEFKKLKGVDGYQIVVKNVKNFLKKRNQLGARRPLLAVKMINFGNQKTIKQFRQLWTNMADSVIVQPLHGWEGTIKIRQSTINDQQSTRYPCNLPWLNPAIFWDGKVVPCCVNFKGNELVLGNVKKNSLKRIFQGKKFQALRKAHLNQDFTKYPTCARCQYWQQLPNMSRRLKNVSV